MADKKISALTAATTPLAGTEVLPIVQSGTTVKVSIADVTAGRAVSSTSIAADLGAVGTPAYTFTGDTNTGMWSPAADTIAFSEGGVEAMRITSAGDVGIGTSSPASGLELSSNSGANIFSTTYADNLGGGNYVGRKARGTSSAPTGALTDDQLAVLFARGYTSASAFSGNVGGIGIYAAENFTGTNNGTYAAFATTAIGATGRTERMRITSAGNVGIGTSSPGFKLDVNGTGYFNSDVQFFSQDGFRFTSAGAVSAMRFGSAAVGESTAEWAYSRPSAATILSMGNTGSALTERMRITSAGNVGIGTASPSFQLQLSTDSAAKPTTNLWTIVSDSRIKTETGEYTKGLDAVCALRPVTYHYNGTAGFVDDGKESISIIAQEAMQHFPECVGTFEVLLNEDDEEKTELFNWNGHALIFALVNAVKELKAMNETLAARVAQIEGV